MLHDGYDGRAFMTAGINYVNEVLRLKLAIEPSKHYTDMPGYASFTKPVRLGLSVLAGQKFHDPVVNDPHCTVI